mmetsp:Transcript_12177/g.38562  ORF Transcript_12177/g.38562 Transcript_12177/m.38562 type:complete len:535 (+) Transcript_12177:94-1698(+)
MPRPAFSARSLASRHPPTPSQQPETSQRPFVGVPSTMPGAMMALPLSAGPTAAKPAASLSACSFNPRPHGALAAPAIGRSRRRIGVITAAAPPSADRGPPVSYDEMVQHLFSGCKPRDKWRIGTEHEKFGFVLGSHERIDYNHVRELLEELQKRFGWKPMMENGNIIGLLQDGQSVTLEPGGQFELSGAPLETIHQTCAEVNNHLYQVKAVCEDIGIGFLGTGFDPVSRVEDVAMMPKGRYDIMKAYMPKVGTMGLDMMFRSCTVQVNLDFESEADMVEKFRISLALQPVATALFANSPFKDGKVNGFKSYRSHIWTDTDNDRCGDLPFVFEEGFGFEEYANYVMDVPMYFVYDGGYKDASGQSFRDFMKGELPAAPGRLPTMSDWEDHLTTVFPEVRMKRFLEMRGADSGPWRKICSLPALWVGILYDDTAQKEAWAMVADWTEEERAYLRANVPRQGLQTPFRGGTVQDLCKQMVAIAKGGLERRGHNEASFLSGLEEIAESGKSQADLLLELYEGEWGGDIDRIYNSTWVY